MSASESTLVESLDRSCLTNEEKQVSKDEFNDQDPSTWVGKNTLPYSYYNGCFEDTGKDEEELQVEAYEYFIWRYEIELIEACSSSRKTIEPEFQIDRLHSELRMRGPLPMESVFLKCNPGGLKEYMIFKRMTYYLQLKQAR